MTTINDPQTPIGEVIQLAGTGGILLEMQGESPFALMPLTDDLVDFLIERNPRLIDECNQIRQRMRDGSAWTQTQVNALFGRGE